jgi:hypothetical protein
MNLSIMNTPAGSTLFFLSYGNGSVARTRPLVPDSFDVTTEDNKIPKRGLWYAGVLVPASMALLVICW